MFIRSIAASGLVAVAVASAHGQVTAYTIGGGGSTLLSFDVANPTNVTTVGSFNGDQTFLDGIDFRPLDGRLYGYLDSTDSFYTVDLTTATLTRVSVGAAAAPTNTFHVGLDFNPQIDRARLVTDSSQNIVFNPNTGTVAAFTELAYAIGDQNENASPAIIENAYDRNVAGTTATLQYAIDYNLNALVTLANNTGVLTTRGSLGINVNEFTGFDIFTRNGDTAYAIFSDAAGASSFYTINLASGAATLVGAVPSTDPLYGLAVIPAPSTVGLIAAGVVLGARRRRI